MKKIKVFLGKRSYDILIGKGLIGRCGPLLKNLGLGHDALIITNKRLSGLYGKRLSTTLRKSGFSPRFELVRDSEKAKSFAALEKLLSRISRYDINKKPFIIALGGGVVGDLAGFAASIYKRGIPYVQLPTTLLAQVDSSIGGKTAVDLPVAKNMAGSFYQPRIVISDTETLKTLSPRQIRNGLAEVVKYGVIKDPGLFSFIESNYRRIINCDMEAMEHIIYRSARIKADVASKDEFDRKGIRAILNYGHTIGHAIETAAEYSGRYNHGEAVALGMLIAGRIAVRLRILKKAAALKIEGLIRKIGLPVSVKAVEPSKIYDSHLHDKKFVRGRNRFVLASDIGSVKIVEDVPDYAIREAINNCAGFAVRRKGRI
ncbi:MAG: 3-dehydroquinate synthase [Candidatus Omnitrophica bacterium]|nr:3-dehydroquinate synthase [Candidatus Omnitrophota bacterium]